MSKDAKLRRLLGLLDVETVYTSYVDKLFDNLRKTLLKDKEFAEETEVVDERIKKMREAIHLLKERMCALIERFYGELFTEEDIDQLIQIYEMPVTIKMRALQPQITKTLTEEVQTMLEADEKIWGNF